MRAQRQSFKAGILGRHMVPRRVLPLRGAAEEGEAAKGGEGAYEVGEVREAGRLAELVKEDATRARREQSEERLVHGHRIRHGRGGQRRVQQVELQRRTDHQPDQ